MARKGSTQLPEYTPHRTTPPEDPDLIGRLVFHHQEIRRLWAELQLAHRRHVEDVHRPEARYGSTGQRDLGRRIVRLLAEHEALELEQLYPLATDIVGEAWVEHATADHAEISDLLNDVDGENPEDAGVFEVFTEVMTKVLAHVDEEENIIFPMLNAVLADDQLPSSGRSSPSALPPSDDVIDVAQAERDLAVEDDGGNGRSSKLRFRLKRR